MRLSPRHVSSGMCVGVRLLVPERRAKTFKRRVWEERECTPALASSRRQGFGEGVLAQGTGMRLSPHSPVSATCFVGDVCRSTPHGAREARQDLQASRLGGKGAHSGTCVQQVTRFWRGSPAQGTGIRLSLRHVSSGMCVGVRLLVPERRAKTFKRRVWEERCALRHLRPAGDKVLERESRRKVRACACLRDMFCRGCVSEYAS